jgi:hypothetical protein
MNEDITFPTLLDQSWMKTEGNISATKYKISELRRELSRQEQYLESHEREFEQLRRFCNDYSRPFDDVIVTEDSMANFEANLKAVAKGNRINVDISKIAQTIADDFISKLKANAPVDTHNDNPGRWTKHPYGFDYETKGGDE